MTAEKFIKASQINNDLAKFKVIKGMLEGSGIDVFDDVFHSHINDTTRPVIEEGLKFITERIYEEIDKLTQQFDSL